MACGKAVIFTLLLSIAACMGQGGVETSPPSETTPTTPVTNPTTLPTTPTTTASTPATPTTTVSTPATPTTTPSTPTTPATTPTTASTPTTTTTTTTPAPAVCTAAGIFPNASDTTCKTYYRCTATLIRYDYTCPGTSYFNTATAKCTAIKPAGCT